MTKAQTITIPYKLLTQLLVAGAMCSNCCYNLSQSGRIKDPSLKESYLFWDKCSRKIYPITRKLYKNKKL